jgi:hypothetical protein
MFARPTRSWCSTDWTDELFCIAPLWAPDGEPAIRRAVDRRPSGSTGSVRKHARWLAATAKRAARDGAAPAAAT